MTQRLELFALPAMPIGFAVWFLGSSADSFGLGVSGILLLIAGAFAWNRL